MNGMHMILTTACRLPPELRAAVQQLGTNDHLHMQTGMLVARLSAHNTAPRVSEEQLVNSLVTDSW